MLFVCQNIWKFSKFGVNQRANSRSFLMAEVQVVEWFPRDTKVIIHTLPVYKWQNAIWSKMT